MKINYGRLKHLIATKHDINKGNMFAEWVDHMDAWRIAYCKCPEKTIAYLDDKGLKEFIERSGE